MSSPTSPEKMEEELALSLKKALSADDSAPKAKHVRYAILYTFEKKSSGSIWTALKTYPMMSDEVIVFKALILIHKLVRQGHPTLLRDAYSQYAWIESLGRLFDSQRRGYGVMIAGYITFLKAKLEYHHLHPEFSGTFDYEEYTALKGVQDPNEGYETILDLLGLLEKIESFQKIIFGNVRQAGASEGRVAALVPLVEESFGIYQFILSLMTAMHQVIGSTEVLAPLRDKFKRSHYALLKFYDDCSGLKYLTSLIAVPKLPSDAPDFTTQAQIRPPKQSNQTQEDDLFRQQEQIHRQFMEEQEAQDRSRQESELERQRIMELQRQQALMHQQQEQARMMAYQQSQMAHAQLLDAQSQLDYYRQQSGQNAALLQDYATKVFQLEQQLASVHLNVSAETEAALARANIDLSSWKQKYEALAKLYAQLRKEHLDLLTKFKGIKDQGSKVGEDARRETEKMAAELIAKSSELTDALVERNRLRVEVNRVCGEYESRILGLQSQTESLKKDAAEKARIEQESLRLKKEMDDLRVRYEQERMEKEEENQVLQAGMDQALLVLADHQRQTTAGMVNRDDKISELQAQHTQLLHQMMNNVLQACSRTVTEATFELDDGHLGTQTSPEFVLSLIEKAQFSCGEFATSFVKLVNGGDPKDAITTSNAFAQVMVQLLQNGKGVVRLAPDDKDIDDILNAVRSSAQGTLDFFASVKSDKIGTIDSTKKPEYIIQLSKEAQHRFGAVSAVVERLVKAVAARPSDDLGDVVDREMMNAARAIEEATKRLQALLSQQKELNVHSAILQAAMAITSAISNLIKCATASQQEIVAHGHGGAKGAFYKKNNKWTEGLISAAQSVATATTFLVETADGLVSGSKSWEQMVVSAQEVSVATTQLVAASRVKAVPFSKTQDKLEAAAVAVREATKLLVKAAKEASQVSAQSRVNAEVSKLGSHETKVKEMEQQVKILELEKDLQTARYRLAEMRKQGYRDE